LVLIVPVIRQKHGSKMKRRFLLLLALSLGIGIILMIQISRIFAYNSTLSVLLTFDPFHLVIINLAIFLFAIVITALPSRITLRWYHIGSAVNDELNKKASRVMGFKVEEWNAQMVIMRKFTGPVFSKWMLRIIGLVISGVSAFDIFEIIIHMK
jgi:hypothetical protein